MSELKINQNVVIIENSEAYFGLLDRECSKYILGLVFVIENVRQFDDGIYFDIRSIEKQHYGLGYARFCVKENCLAVAKN